MDAAITSFINSPGSLLALLAILLFCFIKGWIMPITWVDKLLKSKDETIDSLTKELDDLSKAAPIVVKIMEELNNQAGQKKVERRNSGDYDA